MKRGFTLIELLAVIVILAVIAVITTLIVLKVIEDVKIGKYKIEEKSLEKAAELYYTSNNLLKFQKEISLNTLVENGFIKNIQDSGKGGYCEGKVILDEDGQLKGCLNCSNYKTEGCGHVAEEVKDTNPGIICGDNSEEDYDNITECHIRSVEDLVAFSYLVNSGKTFEGKTIYLDKDLDINNYEKNKSYVDAEKLALYDINGDGNISSIKEEMTTGKGFKQIGTSSNYFKGIFEGNAYTISNLMINRPSENNVGFIGYISSSAKIKGLNVKDIKVNGNNDVGGLVGYSNGGTIQEINVSGTIKGNQYVAGAIGYTSSSKVNQVIVNAEISGTKEIGGITAGSGNSQLIGIVEGGSLTGTGSTYYGKACHGYGCYNGANVYVSRLFTTSGVSSSNYTNNGSSYTNGEYGNINIYENVIDTYIGGDNDKSGYYFDYDETGDIIVKSIERNPITITLKGKGTEEEPYQISNTYEWKQATSLVNDNLYFEIIKDIDFTDTIFYMMGSTKNPFTGNFNGNGHTLKSINVKGYHGVGVFGVTGTCTIEGLNLENIIIKGDNNNIGSLVGYINSGTLLIGINIKEVEVSGNNDVGGLVGYSNGGTIQEINVSGTVKGNQYVAGAIGYTSSSKVNQVIVNAEISGTKEIGGITAGSGNSQLIGIVEGGSLTGTGSTYYGKACHGYGCYNGANVYVSRLFTTSGVSSSNYTNNGSSYTNGEYGNINIYENVIDTYIGGDNDKSGYYFDYDETGDIIVKSIERNPITITLKGKGTEEEPYQISNTYEWKQATSLVNDNLYFEIIKDIDFTDTIFYMMGSTKNPFTGNFNGNGHTLKSINVKGYHGVGVFGVTGTCTIEGLNLENIITKGDNNNIGSLAGYINSGTLLIGINLKEVEVSGNNNIGGVVGYGSAGTIREVNISGMVKGNQYVGGVLGTSTSSIIVDQVIVNANISGSNYITGISYAFNYLSEIGIVEGGSLTGTGSTYYGKACYGYGCYNGGKIYVSSSFNVSNISSSSYTQNGSSFSSDYYNNLYYYSTLKNGSNPIIETPYSGDINGSGYYFDYNSNGSDIVVVKKSEQSTSQTDSKLVYTKKVTGDDTTPPTCNLIRYAVNGNGFTASYSCTDNTAVKARKHIYWVADPDNVNYEDLIEWPSTSNGTTESVNSVWTVESATSAGIDLPIKGSCYYFYYGANDEAGNVSIYSSNSCLSY